MPDWLVTEATSSLPLHASMLTTSVELLSPYPPTTTNWREELSACKRLRGGLRGAEAVAVRQLRALSAAEEAQSGAEWCGSARWISRPTFFKTVIPQGARKNRA